jgi:hypothetical protein
MGLHASKTTRRVRPRPCACPSVQDRLSDISAWCTATSCAPPPNRGGGRLVEHPQHLVPFRGVAATPDLDAATPDAATPGFCSWSPALARRCAPEGAAPSPSSPCAPEGAAAGRAPSCAYIAAGRRPTPVPPSPHPSPQATHGYNGDLSSKGGAASPRSQLVAFHEWYSKAVGPFKYTLFNLLIDGHSIKIAVVGTRHKRIKSDFTDYHRFPVQCKIDV